jgi:SPP1 family predicted phage head-tail adaptor
MLDTGAMREQVKVQRQTTTQDAAGQPGLVWSDQHICRAKVARQGGKEFVAAQQRNARVSTVFVIRYTTLVQAKDRVVNRGKVFDIVAAYDPDGRNEKTQLDCEERVGEVP